MTRSSLLIVFFSSSDIVPEDDRRSLKSTQALAALSTVSSCHGLRTAITASLFPIPRDDSTRTTSEIVVRLALHHY
jgi:hypothetical protein